MAGGRRAEQTPRPDQASDEPPACVQCSTPAGAGAGADADNRRECSALLACDPFERHRLLGGGGAVWRMAGGG